LLLVATFSSTSRFGPSRPLLEFVQIGNSVFRNVRADNLGAIAAFDFESGELVYSRLLDSPAGFTFTDDLIFVNSMHGSRISVLDLRLDLVDTLATPLMNDLHSISPSSAGFLVTCSGTDAVLEITADGEQLWTWLACEHGFGQTSRGKAIRIDRQRDYRSTPIDTREQSTHCNSALAVQFDGRDVVLATLFHQGQLIASDKRTGKHSVLVSGMRNPHSVRRRADGWVVSEARQGAVILLDKDFWIAEVIEKDFNWVQDALPFNDDQQLIIADANNNRFVLWDIANAETVRDMKYSADWDVYQLEIVDPRWEERFRVTAAAGQSEKSEN